MTRRKCLRVVTHMRAHFHTAITCIAFIKPTGTLTSVWLHINSDKNSRACMRVKGIKMRVFLLIISQTEYTVHSIFISRCARKEYDRSDTFPFDYKSNEIQCTRYF